ncbi:MAG: ABC transporter ATP-binding protein [Chloroflexota bacterium]|nr:ABC transporter ATP-binding protein [Chloroflexota bacterium]
MATEQTEKMKPDLPTAHLRLDGVTKRFGAVAAVERITLDISRGSFTTLLGPSGCGKTTLLRMIAGFYEPDEGSIYLDDKRIDQLPAHRRGTAMVFQDYALWPHMTVFDNIAYGLRMRQVKTNEIRERVIATMQLVEMPAAEILTRKPSELSGGQQQRVALARALIVQPQVLLLDEPLSNLDAQVRLRLRVEIRHLQRRIGITTIYVTHDQEEALSMSDRVVVMSKGRVMQIGRPEEIYHQPTNAFVAEFLGVTNQLRGTVAADGQSAIVAGVSMPFRAAPGSAVLVIFKADQAQIARDHTPVDGSVIFRGHVEESSFIGTVYRHYVSVSGEMILIDTPEAVTQSEVNVIVPKGKLQVYGIEA